MNAAAQHPTPAELQAARDYGATWEDNHPAGDSHCYSDDADCGCGRESA